jgi:hypothetical protein
VPVQIERCRKPFFVDFIEIYDKRTRKKNRTDCEKIHGHINKNANFFTALLVKSLEIRAFNNGTRFAKSIGNKLAKKNLASEFSKIGDKKMILKVYGLIWLLGILAVAVLFLTGNFTPVVSVVFGFLSFGAIFMGMIGVLPLVEAPHSTPKH